MRFKHRKSWALHRFPARDSDLESRDSIPTLVKYEEEFTQIKLSQKFTPIKLSHEFTLI